MSSRNHLHPPEVAMADRPVTGIRKPYVKRTLNFYVPKDIYEQGNFRRNGRFIERLAGEARSWMGKVAAVLEEVVARKAELDAFDAWLNNRGADFRHRREALGLSCLVVARHAGIDHGRYWRYEKQEKSLPTAAICDIERQLGGEPPPGWNLRLALEKVSFWGVQKKPPSGTTSMRVSVPLTPDEIKAFHHCALALGLTDAEVLHPLARGILDFQNFIGQELP